MIGGIQDRDDYNGTTTWLHDTLSGYSFDSLLFAEKPVSGTLFANRDQTSFTQTFSRTDGTFDNYGAGLRVGEDSLLTNWGVRHFTSSLRAEHQHVDETTTNDLGPTFVRNETRDILTYNGHNGFETADLDWQYEHTDFKNIPFPTGNYRNDAAHLNYSVDFGPNLNRRSDTNLTYIGRSGTTPTDLFIADEHVVIDHFTNLSTDYRYQFFHQVTGSTGEPSQSTTSQLGSFQVRYEPYRNFSTTAVTSALHMDVPTGKRNRVPEQRRTRADR
jgi:hypothetical protein